MTDQPTKGPFTFSWTFRNTEEGQINVWTKAACIASFTGPDREANAALFIRAQQHMDELVEAVGGLLSVAYGAREVLGSNFANIQHEIDVAQATLAKIQGEK
jgi:hypothetical protein